MQQYNVFVNIQHTFRSVLVKYCPHVYATAILEGCLSCMTSKFTQKKIQRSKNGVSSSEKNIKFTQRSMLIGAEHVTLSTPTYKVVLFKAFK